MPVSAGAAPALYNSTMELTELQPPNLEQLTRQYVDRSEGLHLSAIIHDILCTMDPERYEEREGGSKWLNFLSGLMFERALEMAWLDKEREYRPELIRPGEVELDGIIGTPDAYDTLIGQPEEYKCTKKSCRQDITDRKFWHYWVQLKAYAHMMECNTGVLWVLFINGNYSRDPVDDLSGYVMKGWRARWTKLELEENWMMLAGHARRKGWLR